MQADTVATSAAAKIPKTIRRIMPLACRPDRNDRRSRRA
jgi:hypothetical protein